ncbi:hypothetical protein NM04_19295 [Massilia aurea]|uniref:Uncharacterized protein n=1 Tax=Massilia aurea TaxID=373040 RepID=A0A422QGT9_9BURK|nr:hypothetical protein [Massilia aurea]RNF29178.1 hypothetical protein NM04_19295 [Massilia aurea]
MNTASNPGSGKDDSVTVGVGGQTSGQQDATPSHESQTETGGNGGPGLTRNQSGRYVNAPDGTEGAGATDAAPRTESVDAAMTHANPGAQDTRSGQAGVRDTGLGTPETGGNQDERDLPPVQP